LNAITAGTLFIYQSGFLIILFARAGAGAAASITVCSRQGDQKQTRLFQSGFHRCLYPFLHLNWSSLICEIPDSQCFMCFRFGGTWVQFCKTSGIEPIFAVLFLDEGTQ
jgi:hypothetical protein